MLVYIALLLGVLLLYFGGDWLLEGVSDMGLKMQWPKAITGLLLVSLGTSAPELFVSVGSALQGHGAMAAGNVIGSNIINSAIVLGLAVCVATLVVERTLQQQLVAMAALSFLAAAMIGNGHMSRFEGLTLMGLTFISLVAAFVFRGTSVIDGSVASAAQPDRTTLHSCGLALVGIITLLVGAEALIWAGINLAERFNISESVVALTVTAFGTSLPEIAATVVAVLKRETSMAVGNVIGSNLLNLGLVLGLSATVLPLENTDTGTLTITVFLGLAVFVTVLGLKPGYYPRWTGAILLVCYAFYATLLVQGS